jgi:hypothetical protein
MDSHHYDGLRFVRLQLLVGRRRENKKKGGGGKKRRGETKEEEIEKGVREITWRDSLLVAVIVMVMVVMVVVYTFIVLQLFVVRVVQHLELLLNDCPSAPTNTTRTCLPDWSNLFNWSESGREKSKGRLGCHMCV